MSNCMCQWHEKQTCAFVMAHSALSHHRSLQHKTEQSHALTNGPCMGSPLFAWISSPPLPFAWQPTFLLYQTPGQRGGRLSQCGDSTGCCIWNDRWYHSGKPSIPYHWSIHVIRVMTPFHFLLTGFPVLGAASDQWLMFPILLNWAVVAMGSADITETQHWYGQKRTLPYIPTKCLHFFNPVLSDWWKTVCVSEWQLVLIWLWLQTLRLEMYQHLNLTDQKLCGLFFGHIYILNTLTTVQ